MLAHPISYMELSDDPEYTLYNSMQTLEFLSPANDYEIHWLVRTDVIFRHRGELPIEISATDGETLLIRVFPRNVMRVRLGLCAYQFA